jgi:hypothetical protein
MRGLLVTPWFAAGAGFVIAAALALNSPHTVLTYRPNTLPCSTCIRPAPGSLASAKPGIKLKVPAPAKHAQSSRGAAKDRQAPATAAGLEVGFRVVWQKNGAFGAIITLPAGHAGRDWKLRFAIPGRRIFQVAGAQWLPLPSGYGGEASMLTAQPGFSGHSGPPGGNQSGGPQVPGQPGQRSVRRFGFFVAAQGAPVTPVDCVLDGVACHFG